MTSPRTTAGTAALPAPLAALPGRTLDAAELRRLTAALAAEPGLRTGLEPPPQPGERRYRSLHRDDHVDVWLICWGEQGDTGWHDHDTSAGAFAVLSGLLRESRPSLAGPARTRELAGGDGAAFGPDHIHRLEGGAPGSVSVHAYSPPLWRMGQYSTDPDGALRRRSVSYAEELRPIA